MEAAAYVNDRLHHRLPRRRFRGPTWRDVLSRKQSRLLAEFLRKDSALKLASSQDEMTSQDLDISAHIQATLSYDLLYQIFMLLPAESLFRLQFVCKQWFSLINNALFVTTHAQQCETILVSQHLSFWPQGSPRPYFHFLSLDDWGSSFVESSVDDLVTVQASYDGLILASSLKRKCLIFMNPVTGKYVELPLGAACHPLCESFGIAFCNQAKTYKVVHIFRETSRSIGCEILNILTRSWTRIREPPELLRIRQRPVSVGGSLYWLSSKQRDCFVSIIVHDEKFVSKKLPVRRVGTDRLLEIGGSLGFVTHAELNILQVWILIADIGESEERWIQRYSINLNAGLTHCIPICSRRNGQEMVLESIGNQLYVYNIDRDEMKAVNSGSDDEPWFGRINRLYIPHRNTIVSCNHHSLVNKYCEL